MNTFTFYKIGRIRQEMNIDKMINNIEKVKILVIGDFMIDEYLIGKMERINPEAPVPILNVESKRYALGGAGNVANNLVALGARAIVSTVIGDDSDVDIMKKLLKKCNISTEGIFIEQGRITTKKTRLISKHQQIIRYDTETITPITKQNQDKIFQFVKNNVDNVNAIIIEDYFKGVFTKELLQEIIKLSKEKEKILLIDPAKRDWGDYEKADIITPNMQELEFTMQRKIETEEDITKAGNEVIDKYKLQHLLLTRGEKGMTLLGKKQNSKINIPTKTLEVYDESGAGDTVIATFTAAISCGMEYEDAALISNIAAGIVVGKFGVSTVTLNELIKCTQTNNSKYISNKDLEIKSRQIKDNGNSIVFTNGCFDIIHAGHVELLKKAAKLGDVLIVAINSDESVKKLKGSKRPIYCIEDRINIMSAIEYVDYVTVFEEDTPYEIIKKIKPQTIVKGGDYKASEVVGCDIVGIENIHIVPLVEGKSSTKTIEKMKRA